MSLVLQLYTSCWQLVSIQKTMSHHQTFAHSTFVVKIHRNINFTILIVFAKFKTPTKYCY